MVKVLDNNRLRALCPSIFAEGGSSRTSDRYGFIPTIAVVEGLRVAGFEATSVMGTRSRSPERGSHGKHLIRFRHRKDLELDRSKGEAIPEIVMVNSHDGSCSYQLRGGVYRVVCMNGLIVGDEYFSRKVRHSGNVVDAVVEAANDLVAAVPRAAEKALEWKGVNLSREMQLAFADTAATLRWTEEEQPVDASTLLMPNRAGDVRNDLWTTFNRLQENIVKGGQRYYVDRERRRTREVGSVAENVRLNTALWALTQRMSELVA